MYRLSGACSTGMVFTSKLNASAVTLKTYDDLNVAIGKYCYVVRAADAASGLESLDSPQAEAAVRPWGVIITVNVN